MDRKAQKVLVGMSGGVDSSVTALLLQAQGYEVAGATLRLWPSEKKDIEDAKAVCETLGIEHHTLDCEALFRQRVVDYFAAEYRRGATPNPCVACNRHLKFGVFLDKALAMGFDCIATGHYAEVRFEDGRYRLRRGKHSDKDQSYVLYTLTQERLARVLMPLGDYSKPEVRRMAEQAGLLVSRKSDSQDICFVPDGDYAAFLEDYTGEAPPPGDFLDASGRVLGRHRGIWHYTIGQRKGLGISFSQPMYVSAVDAEAAAVTLSVHEALFSDRLQAEDLCWIEPPPSGPLHCTAKIRYGATPSPATVRPLPDGQVEVLFDSPQRAITPGQAVVFYDGDYLLGGGRIV